MNIRTLLALAGSVAVISASVAMAQSSGMPGDRGRPADGIPLVNPPPRPPDFAMPRATVRTPAIELAVEAAQTIATACKQYPLGVAVVNAEGSPILVYVPDGSDARHSYTAIRKAFSAITFKSNTSQLISKGQQDAAFAATIKANPNLMVFGGGILLKVGNDTIGAIGVSGAEPGGHDEECGLKGLAKIESRLK